MYKYWTAHVRTFTYAKIGVLAIEFALIRREALPVAPSCSSDGGGGLDVAAETRRLGSKRLSDCLSAGHFGAKARKQSLYS
jgi:hypothetical protein